MRPSAALALAALAACAGLAAAARPATGAAATGRALLQKPGLCDAATGRWEASKINCDFSCDGAGWEVGCSIDENDKDIRCKVDADGAPDSEEVKFRCPIPARGAAPECPLEGVAALKNACVADAVKAALGAWKVGA
jgi:hypothetical protein